MKKNFFRQGDVGLQLVASLPVKAVEVKPTEPHRIVLAYGEVTGHAHALHEVTKVREFSYEAERFIQVMETTSLKHEEHAPISLTYASNQGIDCSDPRFKTYFIRVPPDVQTAHEGVAWTFGKTPKTYHPLVQT